MNVDGKDGMDSDFGMNSLCTPAKEVIRESVSKLSMLSTPGGAQGRYMLAWIISEWLNAIRETGVRPEEDAA